MGFENSGGGGGGGVLPPSKFPGDLLVGTQAPVGGWADGSAPNLFQTQAAWYVDSAIGNDANDGTLGNPLLTIENLSLRLSSAILQQNTTIHLSGSFANQVLWLPRIAAGFTGTVQGTATTVHAGTITALANRVLGTSAPNFTDAAIVDVAPYVNKRIRITAGAAIGRWAFIEFKMAATQAEVSQWNIDGVEGNASANTYVIEDLPTVGGIYQANPDTTNGFGLWTVRDCNVFQAYSDSPDVALTFAGCSLGKSGQFAGFGGVGGNFLGCYTIGNFIQLDGAWLFEACGSAAGSEISTAAGGLFNSDYGLYQDQIHIAPGSTAQLTTDNAVQRATHAGNAAYRVDPGASTYLLTGTLWGANAGMTNGLRIYSGGAFVYGASKPTITGASGAAADVAGTLVLYANVPAVVNGASLIQENAVADSDYNRFYANTVVPQSEAAGSYIASVSATTSPRGMLSYQYGANANGAKFIGLKARGSRGAEVALNNGDVVMSVQPFGEDTVPTYVSGARIDFVVDAAPGAGTVPTAVRFYAGTAGGGAQLFELSSAGIIKLISTPWPGDPIAGDLGKSLCVTGANTIAWKDNRDMIFFGTATMGNTTSARMMQFSGLGTPAILATIAPGETVMGRPGRVVAIYTFFRGGALAVANVTWAVTKNEAATADTMVQNATNQSASGVLNTSFVAGDRIGVQSTCSAADNTASIPIVCLVLEYG